MDDQRPPAEPASDGRQLGTGARAKDHARRGGEFERHDDARPPAYQAPSSGWTLVHHDRVRGSAIIGVTASTHAR